MAFSGLLQSCPFRRESVPTALQEGAGQGLARLPPSPEPASQTCSVPIFHFEHLSKGKGVGVGTVAESNTTHFEREGKA